MVGVILGFVVAGVDRPFWMILDGICCPKYDRSTSGEGGDPAKPGEAHRGGEGETRRSPAKPSGVGWNPAKPGEAHRGRSG